MLLVDVRCQNCQAYITQVNLIRKLVVLIVWGRYGITRKRHRVSTLDRDDLTPLLVKPAVMNGVVKGVPWMCCDSNARSPWTSRRRSGCDVKLAKHRIRFINGCEHENPTLNNGIPTHGSTVVNDHSLCSVFGKQILALLTCKLSTFDQGCFAF